jgi:hypothetical protein
MVDFTCTEYGDGKAVADEEFRKRIRKIGIRRVARESNVDRETVALIANGNSVKPGTLSKVSAVASTCLSNGVREQKAKLTL